MEEEKSPKLLGKIEYQLLNYALKDHPFWLKVFENLKPTFFEKEDNQKIFNFFREYYTKYKQLPAQTIASNELKDMDPSVLAGVYEQPPEDAKNYIYDKTLDWIKENMMIEAFGESINILKHRNKERFDEVEAKIRKAVRFNMDVTLGIKLSDVDGRYVKIKSLETERIETGFPQLDALLHGGWGRKELYACAAPPGIGKSIFLANWAVQAMKHDHNVLVYTLEIAEERLSMRHDAILTKIPIDELTLDIEAIKQKYKIFAKMSKSDMLIKEFPTKAVSINQLKSHYEQLILYEDFEPDIIFVDYAGLLRPSYRIGDNYEDLRSIFEELRGWAVELDIPIVTAAQTNRKSMDDKGGTKEIITQVNVADSLGITQTLDGFFTITQSRTEKEEGLINLYCDKHRSGESSKSFKMTIDYKNFILEELEI
jgi:replicative DNA helicase